MSFVVSVLCCTEEVGLYFFIVSCKKMLDIMISYCISRDFSNSLFISLNDEKCWQLKYKTDES